MSNDFSAFITSNEMCIVRELKLQCTMNGSPLLMEFDCLILQLTENLPAISSHSIACPLSIVHICDNLCMFSSEYVFNHDYTSNLFCLNIYCIPL